jgi:hypothetical protein
MPSAQDIVDSLTAIANEWRTTATAWHVFLGVLLLSLFMGWRPSARLLAPMLIIPLWCVSIVAGLSGNGFNSGVFAALALILGALAFTRSERPVSVGPPRLIAVGAALIVFGATYPHFVEVESWMSYAYAAPFGIVPCPTLAVVIGLSLMLNGVGSPAWSAVLAVVGVFYGLVGIVWLDVPLDGVLLAGAVALGVHAIGSTESRMIHPRSQTSP